MLFTALAVWHCPYPPYPVYSACWAWLLCCLQRWLCGIAPILFTVLAWLGSFAIYSACCVALPLSCLQHLLGLALMLFTVLAWHWPNPVYSNCCVSMAQILFTALARLGAFAVYNAGCVSLPLSFFAALALWHCPYPPFPVYSACLAWLLCCLQRLLCDIAPILFTALAWPCFYAA